MGVAIYIDQSMIYSHKRSKSSLALSILHRDRSKTEDRDSEASRTSPVSSTSNSNAMTGSLRPKGQKHLSPAVDDKGDNYTTSDHGDSTSELRRSQTAKDTSPSIEQSVQMFKVFGILRNGDSAAIAEAIRKDCGLSAGESKPPTIVGPPSPNTNSLQGTTILHLAVQCAEPSVVGQILEILSSNPSAKMDVNTQDRDGNTPLHLAAILGRVDTVRLLLSQKQIDCSLLNYRGESPIDLARTPEIFEQLQLSRSIYMDNKVKAVQRLVGRSDYDGLESLLEDPKVEAVLDINGAELATDPVIVKTGGNLLHEAARKTDSRLIQLLLLHGADPFRRDRNGKLPQDVTKDDKTRILLKKSPAAAAAQRGIQEKAILGKPTTDKNLGGKEGREMKGYLKKWTNYTTGYKLRWFVLEDGVLSYYKHQDDAGSACRGAINMRISKLYMDPQDKTRFEIQGKSSVKYHLKANHVVEAKRWFWALNNAIQFAKDEAKNETRRDASRKAILDQAGKPQKGVESTKLGQGTLVPATATALQDSHTQSARVSFQDASSAADDQGSAYEPSVGGTDAHRAINTATLAGDLDEDEEYGDDASSHDLKPAGKDAFNITAHSASLQLELLAQVSGALQSEIQRSSDTHISDPAIRQAVDTYEGAVQSLQSMVGDLLRISRDRDAYWQYRLDRETDMRRLWEDSMARVAREQEQLEDRIGESEDKRKRTKRVLRDVLDGNSAAESRRTSHPPLPDITKIPQAVQDEPIDKKDRARNNRKSSGVREPGRRKSIIADLTNLSDSDSDADEEFFDAVGAGEVQVVEKMPLSPPPQKLAIPTADQTAGDGRETKKSELLTSFKGYEDPVRTRLAMDADNRPKISLWVRHNP